MIALVVPITRLRRDTTWWSYRVPARMAMAPGSLVVVPFRRRETLGIVWKLEEHDDNATLSISQVLSTTPLVRQPQRQLVEIMSQRGLCSLSTALYVWLPRALRGFPLSARTRELLGSYSSWQPPLASAPQHAILTPSKRPEAALELHKRFGAEFSDSFADITADQELEQWLGIARGEIRVALGREGALFAPWLNLQQLTIIEPEDIAYYHEQIPYCNLGELAGDLARLTRARLIAKSGLPGSAAQLLWGPEAIGQDVQPAQLDVIDLRLEPLLSKELVEKIQKVLANKQQILLLYNAHDRVGPVVEDSGNRTIIPGIETVGRRLAHLLGYPLLPKEVILGTRSILSQQYQNVGLTVVLSLDPLTSHTVFADILHGIADLGQLFAYGAPCIIQSHNLDHPLVQALCNHRLPTYVTGLVEKQRANHLPPFGQQIFCSLPSDQADDIAQKLYDRLAPLVRDPWQISFPFSSRWRKKQFRHVMLSAPNPDERLPVQIREIISELPRPWRIQHNPWYIL